MGRDLPFLSIAIKLCPLSRCIRSWKNTCCRSEASRFRCTSSVCKIRNSFLIPFETLDVFTHIGIVCSVLGSTGDWVLRIYRCVHHKWLLCRDWIAFVPRTIVDSSQWRATNSGSMPWRLCGRIRTIVGRIIGGITIKLVGICITNCMLLLTLFAPASRPSMLYFLWIE